MTTLKDQITSDYESGHMDGTLGDPEYGTEHSLMTYFDSGYAMKQHQCNISKMSPRAVQEATTEIVGQIAALIDMVNDHQAIEVIEALEAFLNVDATKFLMRRISVTMIPGSEALVDQALAGDKESLLAHAQQIVEVARRDRDDAAADVLQQMINERAGRLGNG